MKNRNDEGEHAGPLDPAAEVDLPAPNYTQVPNAILDVLMPQMGEAELKVVLAIARETFGWQRKEKELSLTRLCELTGLCRETVCKGIKAGMERNLIKRRPHKRSFIYELKIHEAKPSSPTTSLRNRPTTNLRNRPTDASTKPTDTVYETDRSAVGFVDAANKELNKGKETLKGARRGSMYFAEELEQYSRERCPGVKNHAAYAEARYRDGCADRKVAAWKRESEKARARVSEPMPGTVDLEALSRLQGALERRLNQQSYQKWIEPIDRLSIDGNTVHLAVPSVLFEDWITINYSEEIAEGLEESGLGDKRLEWWSGTDAPWSEGAR